MMDKRNNFIFIVLGIVALVVALIIGISRAQFTTSVVDLLPSERTEFKILSELAEQDQGRLLTVRLFSKHRSVSPSTGLAFLEALQQDPLIEKVWLADYSALREAGAKLFHNRYQWMLPTWLEQNFPEWKKDTEIDSNVIAGRVIDQMDRYLSSPEGTTLVETIPEDPFILMEQVLNSTALLNQPLEKNDLTLWIRQRASPFSKEGQEPVFQSIEAAFLAASQGIPGLQMEYSGVSRFAAASEMGIKGEIERFNLFGLILVLIVTAYWVRSIRTTFHIFLVVTIALVSAATTVIFAFPTVHVISLVIGSILAGIAVDYAFHLLLTERCGLDKQSVTKAVVTGSISSALGFIILLWAPLPFLKQVGAFVGSGLIAALLAALVLRSQKREVLPKGLSLLNPFSLPAWTGPLLVLICIPGLHSIEWEDHIGNLEYPLPKLKSTEQRLRWQSPLGEQNASYLVYGKSLMEASERLRQLHLDADNAQLLHLGTWIPDLELIQATHQYFKEKTGFISALRQAMEDRGYHANSFDPFFENWDTYIRSEINEKTYTRSLTEFSVTLPGPLTTLIHTGEQLSWFMVLSPSTFRPNNTEGVIQLDQKSILSAAFSTYRQTLITFSSFCLLGLSLAVLSIYGLARGAAALAIPTLAVLAAYGLCGHFSTNLGLFHIVGTLLAFCISLDYALFGVVSHQKHYRLPASVCISAITTLGAFAILMTSSIPAIQQLSSTILVIISMNLLLMSAGWPLVRRGAVPGRWCFHRLPHGQQAQFIEKVETLSETSIETLCKPQLADHLSEEWFLEAMAQSAGVMLAYNNTNQNQPRSGIIVIVQQFKLPSDSCSQSAPLSFKVESLSKAREGLILFKGCCLNREGGAIAESSFSIFIPPVESDFHTTDE